MFATETDSDVEIGMSNVVVVDLEIRCVAGIKECVQYTEDN
jgi:hypothetical protein